MASDAWSSSSSPVSMDTSTTPACRYSSRTAWPVACLRSRTGWACKKYDGRQRAPGPAPQLNLAPSQLQRPGVPTDAVVRDEGGLHPRVAAHPYQAAVPVFQRERPEEVL